MPETLFDAVGRYQTAWATETQKAWSRWLSVPAVAQAAQNTRVGTTPHEVVWSDGTVRLLRYRRDTPAAFDTPVVFCYALVNRPYILDLQSEKSVVRQYLARGFEVYLIDWGTPSPTDRGLTLEDYVAGYLRAAVRVAARRHDRPAVHLLGYCMGGTMSVLFTAAFPKLVTTLTLLAAPVDFSSKGPLLNLWTDAANFDVDALIDAHGNCPAEFLQGCFQAMKPVQNYVEKYLGFYENMADAKFVENYFAMETWVNDNIPVAGETFREFVKKLYQGNQLVRGEFWLGTRRIDLKRITCPLLLLMARGDHLVPPESTAGIRPLVGSQYVTAETIDAGHVGLVVSGKAHKTFWPAATAWLADQSGRRPAAGPNGKPTAGES